MRPAPPITTNRLPRRSIPPPELQGLSVLPAHRQISRLPDCCPSGSARLCPSVFEPPGVPASHLYRSFRIARRFCAELVRSVGQPGLTPSTSRRRQTERWFATHINALFAARIVAALLGDL